MPPLDTRHGGQVIVATPRTGRVATPASLHAVFEHSVAEHPDAIAIEVPPSASRPGRTRFTYAQIDALATRLAGRLAPRVTRDAVVAIVLPRDSHWIYVAQLAILKAGAAYTCIEPGTQPERARFVLEDSRAVAVVTSAALCGRVAEFAVKAALVVGIDGAEATATRADGAPRPATNGNGAHAPQETAPDSLAYVIYTSGTSGRPKGVMIEHRSVVNLAWSDRYYFDLGPGDRAAQSSSCAYDSSVEEIWLAFATGATLVVMDDETVRLGPDLVPWLRREGITVFCPPPTLLRMASCDDPERDLPDLRLVYVGGEELPADVAARWSRGRRLENGYGPTECTVTVVRTPVIADERVTIGWPVDGNRAWILDESLEEAPPGTPGELCIGGTSVARGYLNLPELTAERFVQHPVLGRIYRTGDLVERTASGALACLGRSDSQVKIRGHRVELSEIEAQLCGCDGVVAAACSMQGDAHARELAAFLVTDGGRPADLDLVRDRMRTALPEHMRPVHYAVVPVLPTRDNSGKLDRSALPVLRRAPAAASAPAVTRTPAEAAVAAAFRSHVPHEGHMGLHEDFFLDLGGNSLIAAQVVSTLRRDPVTASLTVRDVYEARTIAAIAARAVPVEATAPVAPLPAAQAARTPAAGALGQLAWIAAGLVPGSAILYAIVFGVLPALDRIFGSVALILLLPALAFLAELAWVPVSLALAVAAKTLLVGRYREGRHDWLGAFHVKHWIVLQFARMVPWHLVEGTGIRNACLRALGARIGRNVHLHRGVDLSGGGWDLIAIGDDVTVGRDASLGVAEYHDRQLVLRAVTLESGSTLDTRAHVPGGGRLGRDSFLGALSMLPPGGVIPPGERWEGVPAQRLGPAPPASSSGPAWSAAAHAAVLVTARAVFTWASLLPGLALAALMLRPGAPGTGLLPAPFAALPLALAPLLLVAGYALSLPVHALLARALPQIREGNHALRSFTGIAIVLKDGLVETANGALSGTLLWPFWLRAAGTRVGRKCEISTVMEVVPELLEIGDECFFADGIYLGRPLLHRGIAECRRTVLSRNTFFGNHAVIPAGAKLPPGILLGICTVADEKTIRPGTSWFGIPAFELPRREIAEADRELTHDPSWDRWATRVFFESLRLVLPLVPLGLAWAWFRTVPAWRAAESPVRFFLLTLPLVATAIGATLCVLALAVKWFVLGPIREGRHALWSCWCCRWDILYEVWAGWALPVVMAFEGTPFVSLWLRAMGCRIGRGVVFGSSFLQVVDPDMLHIEDGATVSCHIQSHSFEDRVLKLASVRIGAGSNVGRGAVLLYGADIGERAEVGDNSIVMKNESLLPGLRYVGCPTRAAAGRA